MADEETKMETTVIDEETKTKTFPVRRFRGDAKVRLLEDANGVKYGPENNPKKKGSKTHERFKLYKDGKTVEELLADGAVYGDFGYDEDHGFVVFEAPKE